MSPRCITVPSSPITSAGALTSVSLRFGCADSFPTKAARSTSRARIDGAASLVASRIADSPLPLTRLVVLADPLLRASAELGSQFAVLHAQGTRRCARSSLLDSDGRATGLR